MCDHHDDRYDLRQLSFVLRLLAPFRVISLRADRRTFPLPGRSSMRLTWIAHGALPLDTLGWADGHRLQDIPNDAISGEQTRQIGDDHMRSRYRSRSAFGFNSRLRIAVAAARPL